MSETLLLIPGRTSEQGTSLNRGKLKEEYLQVTSELQMNPDDMVRLHLHDGDRVRLSNAIGETFATCKATKPAALPSGVVFMAYGPGSSQLMDSDTAGSGMPLSKHIDVCIEKLSTSNGDTGGDVIDGRES